MRILYMRRTHAAFLDFERRGPLTELIPASPLLASLPCNVMTPALGLGDRGGPAFDSAEDLAKQWGLPR